MIVRKIKMFFKRLRNICRWLPIIWKDQDWDYWHTFEILKTKLRFQSQHFRKHGYHVSSQREAEKMELCIKLIDKVQNEYYYDQQLQNKDEITNKDMMDAIRKHDRAKKLLFNILENNIENWWD
jgi:hypothetical protein